jgi:hypothetical protein
MVTLSKKKQEPKKPSSNLSPVTRIGNKPYTKGGHA